MSNVNVLKEEDYDFEEPEGDGVGAPGIEVWTFEAVAKGTTKVRMEYSRPWEGGEKEEWTYTMTVIVEQNPKLMWTLYHGKDWRERHVTRRQIARESYSRKVQ